MEHFVIAVNYYHKRFILDASALEKVHHKKKL